MNKRLTTATVSKILNFSCVDGPGNRLVIFLQGCNFQCKNCHNPHTIGVCNQCGDCINHCPTNALSMGEDYHGKPQIQWNAETCTHCDTCLSACPQQSNPKTRQYTVNDILTLIRKNSLFISGITVTGGEATLQLNFIVDLFNQIKTAPDLNHLSCMIDSNGSLSETGWHKVLPVLDGAMIDLKAWQQETHQWLTGRDNHRVFKSIQLLGQYRKLHEVRLLHIPTITDFQAEIDELAKYLTQLPASIKIRLNAYHHHGVATKEALSWPSCKRDDIDLFGLQLKQRGVRNIELPTIVMGA